MRIGIIGSRGIPNNYGGFEQFAEYLSVGLVQLGFEIWVYCPHNHPYQKPIFRGVHLIHCFDPESSLGTFGQFIYDFNCLIDSRSRSFDLIYQLGYTSSAIWQGLLPSDSIIITNMDGLEWQRHKYSRLVRKFLQYSEKRIIKTSHYLIADSIAIQNYLDKTYQIKALYIPYGAEKFNNPVAIQIRHYDIIPNAYFLVIARLQADNNIEEIIQAVLRSGSNYPLLIIGNTSNKFGKFLVKKYHSKQIRFLGSIFDHTILDQLRYYAALYFHGHSGGGTNPSLLEAMAASAKIIAHKNPFNEAVLGDDANYFDKTESLTCIIDSTIDSQIWELRIQNNHLKIENIYNWQIIVNQYYHEFNQIFSSHTKINQEFL